MTSSLWPLYLSRALNYRGTYFANDPRVEKGPSDTNRNQVFALSGVYELFFGKDKMFANTSNRWPNYAIGGWQLAGTTTYESGLLFTLTYAECGADQDVDSNFGNPVRRAIAGQTAAPTDRIRVS